MTLVDIFAIAIIVLVIGGAILYIVKQKKKGSKCIGCPYSASCGKSNSCSSCNTQKNK